MEESFLFYYLTLFCFIYTQFTVALCLNYPWHTEGLNYIPIKNIFHVKVASYIKTFLMDANYNF